MMIQFRQSAYIRVLRKARAKGQRAEGKAQGAEGRVRSFELRVQPESRGEKNLQGGLG